MIIHNRKLKDATLTKVKTKEWGDEYLLYLVYEDTDSLGNLHEITLKDVHLPLFNDFRLLEAETCRVEETPSRIVIDVGFGGVTLWNPHNKMTDTIVKYASPKEMTLEEIEKELGYKVKIVNRKD